MLWAALCHCEDCRRAASSDYVSWFGVKRDTVVWTGPRRCYTSSKAVTRSFCGDCGSPLSFETEVFEDETHLYATTLDDVMVYKPTAHIFWSEHLPWVAVSDDLPKHEKGLQIAEETGEEIIKRETVA
ncbi:MAG: GFA family protein [Pseudomonadota bacterium]